MLKLFRIEKNTHSMKLIKVHKSLMSQIFRIGTYSVV